MEIATLAQDHFDEIHDYIEKDANGNVIGLWADYFQSNLTPTDSDVTPVAPVSNYGEITYAGTKPEVKINGSYKKFTFNLYDSNGTLLPYPGDGTVGIAGWQFTIDGVDATPLLSICHISLDPSCKCNANQIKIKFNSDREYINKILKISFTDINGDTASLDVEIIAL